MLSKRCFDVCDEKCDDRTEEERSKLLILSVRDEDMLEVAVKNDVKRLSRAGVAKKDRKSTAHAKLWTKGAAERIVDR